MSQQNEAHQLIEVTAQLKILQPLLCKILKNKDTIISTVKQNGTLKSKISKILLVK